MSHSLQVTKELNGMNIQGLKVKNVIIWGNTSTAFDDTKNDKKDDTIRKLSREIAYLQRICHRQRKYIIMSLL